MAELSDEEILVMFRNPLTREKGYSQLVEKYSKKLYWQIRRSVLSHQDADDVLQNTLLKIWKYLDSFKGDSALYTWLYRVTANEVYQFFQQLNKKRMVSIDNEESSYREPMESSPSPDADKLLARLEQAISLLPDKQRLVFTMRYYDEQSYDDMSQALGTSIGALKASYHHAVKKIEAFLLHE